MVTLMVLVGDVIWTEAMNDYGDKDDIYDDLNCPGGDVTIAGVHPGQVAVARSHEDLKFHSLQQQQNNKEQQQQPKTNVELTS